jgi:hypothetical protein
MEDTWAWRDLPVLEAVVKLFEMLPPEGALDLDEVTAEAELDQDDVAAALRALNPEFLDLVMPAAGPPAWWVRDVTPSARRAVGQWPTGKSLIDQLAAGMAEAAEREPDPERKRALRAVASGLGGMAKAVAVNVATQLIEYKTGGRL